MSCLVCVFIQILLMLLLHTTFLCPLMFHIHHVPYLSGPGLLSDILSSLKCVGKGALHSKMGKENTRQEHTGVYNGIPRCYVISDVTRNHVSGVVSLGDAIDVA